MDKLNKDFFERDTITVAQDLLGKYIVKRMENVTLLVKIVETEAYTGIEDKGCHTYGGKRTKRTETMYGKAGIAYVYTIYGMYNCLNIVTEEKNNPCAVLIRAVQPLDTIEQLNILSAYRYNKRYQELNSYERKNLTNGPGKLCKALGINKEYDGYNLCSEDPLFYIGQKEKLDNSIEIVKSKRINIDYAEEAKDYLYRFYVKGNNYVSKK